MDQSAAAFISVSVLSLSIFQLPVDITGILKDTATYNQGRGGPWRIGGRKEG